MPDSNTKAGIVALVGRPNAGKSTLLNRLVGEHLAITSPKPQTTRGRVVGLLTTNDTQAVLVDTPGLLDPEHALHRHMRATALQALEDADLILHLHDATHPLPDGGLVALAQLERPPRAPVLLVLTKTDLLDAPARAALQHRHPQALLLSARKDRGINPLRAALRERLPDSPFLYPEDDLATQNLRFFVQELIREAALEQLQDEVPHAIAVVVEEFREGGSPVYIRAVLHVERESQKGILVGAGGRRVKALGQAARQRIEPLVGGPVYLDLWVKVLPNWRRDPAALVRLGFRPPPDSDR